MYGYVQQHPSSLHQQTTSAQRLPNRFPTAFPIWNVVSSLHCILQSVLSISESPFKSTWLHHQHACIIYLSSPSTCFTSSYYLYSSNGSIEWYQLSKFTKWPQAFPFQYANSSSTLQSSNRSTFNWSNTRHSLQSIVRLTTKMTFTFRSHTSSNGMYGIMYCDLSMFPCDVSIWLLVRNLLL